MPPKKVTVILLIASLTLLASNSARGQALVSARVLSSEGPVEIQRRAQGEAALQKIAYRVNDELLAGDVIKTFKGGRLVLGLADGSQAIIGEKTTVEITDLGQSPRTIFNLLRGKTRIKIEKMGGRPNPYRVNTPTAVIAVRGTLFDVFATEKETQVFVYEGVVAVSNLTAPEAPVILSPGQRTRVDQARPPATPSRFRPDHNDDTFKPRQPGRDQNAPGRGEHDAARGERDAGGRSPAQPGNAPRQGAPSADRPSPGGQPSGERRPPEQPLPDND